MPRRTHRFQGTDTDLTVADLQAYGMDWIHDGERALSKRTLGWRRHVLEKLLWFLEYRELPRLGRTEIKAFLAYVATGHENPEGRWGSGENPFSKHHARRPVKPRTIKDYQGTLSTMFQHFLAEGFLDDSPMEGLRPPPVREDQIQPFTAEQMLALRDAARLTPYRRRDEALVVFLLDTGARASEACGLDVGDLDFTNRRCRVTGKGDKSRTLPFSTATKRTLWAYLENAPRSLKNREPDDPFFLCEAGPATEERLQRSGLQKIIRRLGSAAGIHGVRCSPHTLRHTFAVEFLRSGGNVFSLQVLLGHTNIKQTQRYVAFAQADIENQHRLHSPADRIFRVRGKR